MILMLLISLYSLNIISFDIVKGEYSIREGSIPSYLYSKINHIKDAIIPRNLKIQISLSTISGILFYSIDKHNNQLIVSLDEGISSNIIIEYNTQQFYVSLQQICGCKICRYQRLELKIQIQKVIGVQCNDGRIMKMQYSKTDKLNKDYPLPYSNMDNSITSTNEAHVWLVNIPQHGDFYPNHAQLSGCIFDVTINDAPIIFTNISDNIERKCTKLCNDHICNGGQCHETYNGIPVCDCSRTFRNGLYCNNDIYPMNIRSISQYFLIQMIKLSWKSSVREILKLENKSVRILLSRENAILSFEYNFKNNLTFNIKGNLSERYVPNMESIFIAEFSENDINFELYNNGSRNKLVVPTNHNLRKERFDSLTLRSGDGVIDLVHKMSPLDYEWRKIHILKYDTIVNEVSTLLRVAHRNIISSYTTNMVVNSTSVTYTNSIYDIVKIMLCVIVILGVIVMVLILVICCIIRRRRKSYKKSQSLKPLLERNVHLCQDTKPDIFDSQHFGSLRSDNLTSMEMAEQTNENIGHKILNEMTIYDVNEESNSLRILYRSDVIPTTNTPIPETIRSISLGEFPPIKNPPDQFINMK